MASYQAVWVPADNPIDGRKLGRIEVLETGLVWGNDAGERHSFSLQQLQIERGGSRDNLLFLKFGDLAHGSFILESGAILSDPILARFAYLKPQLHREKRRSLMQIAALVAVAVILAALIGVLFFNKAPLVSWFAGKTPPALEIKMGELFSKQLLISKQEVVAPQVTGPFKKLTDQLVNAAPKEPAFPYQFHIVHDASPNAFALPGGPIMVTTGLLQAADDAEEVMGVLAHELAHVYKRHVLRQIYGSTALFLILQTLLGDISGLVAVVINNGSYLATQSFSRDFEREADAAGYDLLVKARINPNGLARFFTRMIKLEKDTVGKIEDAVKVEKLNEKLAWLSTHPVTLERRETIEQRMAKERPAFDKVQFDYVQFKDSLEQALRNNELR